MYKRVAVTLAVAAAIGVGACGGGGSSHLSKKDFVKKANAICAASSKKLDKISAPEVDPTADNLSQAQLKDLADFLQQGVALQSSSTHQIRKLNPPAADEGTVKSMLDMVDKGDAQFRDAISAARANDGAKFREQFTTAGKTLNDASAKAKDYGLDTCGSA